MLDLTAYLRRKRWINQGNEYRLKSVEKIAIQTVSNPAVFKDKELSEYITASCAVHAIDGWSFLARAFSAHARGDSDSARFFAYYAELRAAMSILASTGTGVFLSKHIIIDKKRKCELVRGGQTHIVAWQYLSYWAERQGARTLLEEIIRPGDKKLSEWLKHSPMGGVTPRLLAKRWLKSWGVDLRRMAFDRDARNDSSYRPTEFKNVASVPAIDAAKFISDFWSFFEPWPPNFGVADKYLLRTLLHESFYAVRNLRVQDDLATFRAQVLPTIAAVQPTSMSEQEWTDFLCNVDQAPLIQLAGEKSELLDARNHMQMISRAALLLRVATGASDALFHSARLTKTTLQFWTDRFGPRRGFWPKGSRPDSMLDLWIDVRNALTSLKGWCDSTADPDLYALRHDQAIPVQTLCECERVALWGIAQ